LPEEIAYVPRKAPTSHVVDVRGERHHVTTWGRPEAPPVVFLHGWMDVGASFQFLVDALQGPWYLVAPDWRGFGLSQWAPGGYWFPDYFADLEALLDMLVPDGPARVIGHSMGANIAQIYAGVRPQRLAWLVNLEGFGLARTGAAEAPGRFARWLDELREPLREGRFPSLGEFAGFLRSRNPRLTPDRAEFVASTWTRPAPSPSSPGGVELLFDPRHRLVNPILYRREEAEACWACTTAPVLLARGDSGDKRSHAMRVAADAMRAHIRKLEIVAIPGAGHMLHHEDPEALARHIVDFARSHGADCSQ